MAEGSGRASEALVERFQWADVACRCLLQTMGHTRVCQSILCNSQGSDSDFTGGAAAWECAAQMIEAAGRRLTLPIDLTTRTACDPRQLVCVCVHVRGEALV